MTRKKFVTAMLDAINTFVALGNDVPLESAGKFDNAKAGIFFGVDEDGSNEVEHYLLIELADGTRWRIIPERVLQMDPHEQLLWDEYKKADEAGELDVEEKDEEEEDDGDGFLPQPDIGTPGDEQKSEDKVKILTYPSAELRKRAAPVTKEMKESPEFKSKLTEMVEIAKQDGIGLAASQVGWHVNLFLVLVNRNLEKIEPQVIINPQIVQQSKQMVKAEEGCLSVPGFKAPVSRPQEISWTWENLEGEHFEATERFTEDPDGFYIRVIQHESDHLAGVLFIDRLTAVNRMKFESWHKNKDKPNQ